MYEKSLRQKSSILCFDIETIPDVTVVPNLFFADESMDWSNPLHLIKIIIAEKKLEIKEKIEDFLQAMASTSQLGQYNSLTAEKQESWLKVFCLRLLLSHYHLKITDGKNDFPRQLFHEIVCISFVRAGIIREDNYEYYELQEIRTGGNADSSEKDLVSGFFAYLAKDMPRLVSFNGKTFDMPVIQYRAIKHGLEAKSFYSAGDKWENYTQRYSKDWHCDLLEVLSDYGSSAKIKLREVCALLNIPCKYDGDGSDVAYKYDIGKVAEIRNYCEIDALTTYIVYLRYALHNGKTNLNLYNRSVQDIIRYAEGKNLAHLNEFISRWLQLNPSGL